MRGAVIAIAMMGCGGGSGAAVDATAADAAVDAMPDAWPSVTMGSVDPTFGANGVVVIARGDSDGDAGLSIQPSGRILFAVDTFVGSAAGTEKMTAFASNGTIDTTYGTNGSVDVGGGHLSGPGPGNTLYFGLERRELADGSLDSTYGMNGQANVLFQINCVPQQINGNQRVPVLVDPTGRGLFGGQLLDGRIEIGRITVDGQPDTTFGVGDCGDVILSGGSPLGFALPPGGGILVSAYYDADGYVLARVGDDGVVDPSYLAPLAGLPCGVAIDTSGRAVVAEDDLTHGTLVAERFTPSGAYDPTFKGPLMLGTTAGDPACQGVVADPAGGFLIPTFRIDPSTQLLTAQLFAVDATGGNVTVYQLPAPQLAGGSPPPFAGPIDVAIQSDGKLVVGGQFAAADGTTHAFLARYLR